MFYPAALQASNGASRSSRFRLIRLIILAALALFLVWEVATRSLAAYFADARPETAIRLRSSEPTALLNLAEAKLAPVFTLVIRQARPLISQVLAAPKLLTRTANLVLLRRPRGMPHNLAPLIRKFLLRVALGANGRCVMIPSMRALFAFLVCSPKTTTTKSGPKCLCRPLFAARCTRAQQSTG